jgi:Holliday junction resolvase
LSNKSRGISRERDLVNKLRAEGKFAMRAPASLGVDVVEVDKGRVTFWEVKSTRAGPFCGFPPAARAALKVFAGLHGADLKLAWWPYDRSGLHVYPVSEWPLKT